MEPLQWVGYPPTSTRGQSRPPAMHDNQPQIETDGRKLDNTESRKTTLNNPTKLRSCHLEMATVSPSFRTCGGPGVLP